MTTPTRFGSPTWLLRPVIWFPVAYTLVIIVHEGAHALMAVVLGFPATLFNFWVNYHEFDAATPEQRAILGAAGPMSSLVFGSVCWAVYRRVKNSAAGLPLLFVAANGVVNFFGNLMSAAFVGDFSNAAVVLGLSHAFRYLVSAIGLLGVVVVTFAAGRELKRWAPPGVSRLAGAAGLTVVPMVLGTVYVIFVNQPTPMGAAFVPARLVEGALFLFATAGALTGPPPNPADRRPLELSWIDLVAALAVTIAIRVMATGLELR